jgi:hypothetical protein
MPSWWSAQTEKHLTTRHRRPQAQRPSLLPKTVEFPLAALAPASISRSHTSLAAASGSAMTRSSTFLSIPGPLSSNRPARTRAIRTSTSCGTSANSPSTMQKCKSLHLDVEYETIITDLQPTGSPTSVPSTSSRFRYQQHSPQQPAAWTTSPVALTTPSGTSAAI